MAQTKGASRGSARGGRTPCATCGDGEAAQESNPAAVELAKVQNRGCGATWREGEMPAREVVGPGETRGLVALQSAAGAAVCGSGKAGGRG